MLPMYLLSVVSIAGIIITSSTLIALDPPAPHESESEESGFGRVWILVFAFAGLAALALAFFASRKALRAMSQRLQHSRVSLRRSHAHAQVAVVKHMQKGSDDVEALGPEEDTAVVDAFAAPFQQDALRDGIDQNEHEQKGEPMRKLGERKRVWTSFGGGKQSTSWA
jgi:hypothetical protein